MVTPEIVMLVTKISCNSISKRQDELLNVRVNYTYKGPAIRGRLGAVVTQKTAFLEFDEIGSTRKEVYVDLPPSDTPQPLYTNITGMPLAGCAPKTGYGVKVYALDLDGKPEWGSMNVLTVTKEVELELLEVKIDPAGAGYVTVSPEPAGGTEHNWQFPHGTVVYVTAHPNPGYVFKSWSGEMKDTTAITAPVYPMTEKRTITAHFKMIKEYTLSISVTPYGAGTVTKSPNKTRYAEGEYVTLTATPYSGYEFDHWSGDVSGYSSSVTIYMNKDKSIVANFEKAVPPPTAKVSFTVKGDGFPFATSYWRLYHYDRSGNIWQDYTLHRPGDIIHVRNVQSAGRLSCHCCNAFTGEWSEQKYSREFAAIDGKSYRYDIASGIVYYR